MVAAPAVAALAVASPTLAARHAALWLAMALASALLLPAIGLAGGALVAGSKAQALVRAVGGAEVEAPPTVWLGGLPGLGAAAVVLVAIAAADWAVTGATTLVGPGEALLGGLAAASVVAVMAARGAAAGVMPHAVREVAAMDVQRLAHLEIHRPTGLERAVAARLGARAALVHGKDARLVRRRYPMALVAGAVTTLALWIVAAAAPAAAAPWVGAFMFAFVGYGVVQARRMTARPIELPIIRTLPVTAGERATAKRAYVVTWAALYPLVGVGPVLARVGDPLPCAAIVAGGVVAAVALAVATIR
ncbi:MAG: hypothetical protein H6709_24955 [Kofleriaceae bacterium]|nr:hypothetical protein [Kofleriaceae bacterium]MCB9575339.1 hypothetical protein [Kofleriaceae bacterium]